MGVRYIGSKLKIVKEIVTRIKEIVPDNGTVADLMCGTGAVSLELRKKGYRVIASDIMSQACHITRTKIMLQQAPSFEKATNFFLNKGQISLVSESGYFSMIRTLNNLPLLKDYFWREFSPEGKPLNGSPPRKYFTSYNAQKIDSARAFLNNLLKENVLTELEHSLIINDIIMASNDYANIAGTYGHYLSKFTSRALDSFKFKPSKFVKGGLLDGHEVINGYAEVIAPEIKADLCYIDPPYMKRQYAANYHLIETIARGDFPVAQGKSGLRPWRDQYSNFCSKKYVRSAFNKIFTQAKSKHFLISYNSEGLLSKKDLVTFFLKYGKVNVFELIHKRFKSRNEEANKEVIEYLFHLKLN